MRTSRSRGLHLLTLCLALAATPVMAARSSRDRAVPSQGKLAPDLFLAIIHGDLPELQSLLARGADPNARNSLEMTPLFLAAGAGRIPIVEALLHGGAKLDTTTIYGTALTSAALRGSSPVMKLLLDRGAQPNPSRPDGTTVLMLAARNGDVEIVRDLLRRGVDPNAQDNEGATALIYAARDGRVDAGRVLLAGGARVDVVDSRGWTVLMDAAANGHDEFVKLLLEKGANANARDPQGRPPLMLAATYGDHPAVVRTLVEGGADIRATNTRHETALALAVARGHAESAAFLRERGADASAAAGSGVRRTPQEAVQVSLAALQRSMRVFNESTGCVSCHQDGLGRMATGVAREHGLVIDSDVARAQEERLAAALSELRPVLLKALKDARAMKEVPLAEIEGVTPTYAFFLAGMAAHKQPANRAAAAMAMVLARQQLPDGHWMTKPRGPMESSFFTMTALAVQAMRRYAPHDRAAETADRLRRARKWLMSAPAETSEDKAFRLLGLKWAGASLEERRQAIDELRADQRPDGGWPQPAAPRSDAYGTGQALYALHVAGDLAADDPLFQRGIQFLLRTQEEDGSWFVPKRVAPFNDYFDAAFPHGASQYASFNATCWATMALIQTIDPQPAASRQAVR